MGSAEEAANGTWLMVAPRLGPALARAEGGAPDALGGGRQWPGSVTPSGASASRIAFITVGVLATVAAFADTFDAERGLWCWGRG